MGKKDTAEHIDVLAQRLFPNLPPELDARNSESVFYAGEN